MLGFEDALCGIQYFGDGSYNSSSPIWMTDVYCNGYESALDLCYFDGWGVVQYYPYPDFCTNRYYDVGVVCLDGQWSHNGYSYLKFNYYFYVAESITEEVGIPRDVRLISSSTTSLTIGWIVIRLHASSLIYNTICRQA
jgi:hypothetical protein